MLLLKASVGDGKNLVGIFCYVRSAYVGGDLTYFRGEE